jgi:hypothetical protein
MLKSWKISMENIECIHASDEFDIGKQDSKDVA